MDYWFGQKTGRKEDPAQEANDMHNACNTHSMFNV